ncbi:MAG TPA: hypothetical protein VF656_03640 [Pyrinomonadaceae bacterium]
MILLKRPLFIVTVAASFLILIDVTSATQQQRPIAQRPGQFIKALGIEVTQSQNKTFFMQAATANRRISAVIKVPVKNGNLPVQNSVSAIKLDPKLEKDKVRVTVYAIYGDLTGIQKCEDLNSLKTVKVGSYVAGEDKEVSVSDLRKYGVRMEKDPFKFRVISKTIFAPVPNNPAPDSCGCMLCNRATCCPNPGYCVDCDCATVCCMRI